MFGTDEIEKRFETHDLTAPKAAIVKNTRSEFIRLASTLDYNLPDSREKSLVFTALEEALFWANAAVARNDII